MLPSCVCVHPPQSHFAAPKLPRPCSAAICFHTIKPSHIVQHQGSELCQHLRSRGNQQLGRDGAAGEEARQQPEEKMLVRQINWRGEESSSLEACRLGASVQRHCCWKRSLSARPWVAASLLPVSLLQQRAGELAALLGTPLPVTRAGAMRRADSSATQPVS